MQLNQVKIRGIQKTLETEWLQVNSGITSIRVKGKTNRTLLLSALHAINPGQNFRDPRLFSDQPQLINKNGMLRNVQPSKYTVTITIWSASPKLVRDLGKISHHLYETDRIEIGRRLDFSRWMNFVEIASSTRWSEISNDFEMLLSKRGESIDRIEKLRNLKPSDRIKGTIYDELRTLLTQLSFDIGDKQLLAKLKEKIERSRHFRKARGKVYQSLPRFYWLNNAPFSESIDNRTSSEELERNRIHCCNEKKRQVLLKIANRGDSLDTIRSAARNAVIASCNSDHKLILLLDSPEQFIADDDASPIIQLLEQLAELGQVVFVTSDISLLNVTK